MEFNRCMGCMREYEGDGVCPYCGFDRSKYETASWHLQPGTILNGKYVLGKVLGKSEFGFSYLSWDLNLDHKAAVKEYYLSGLVATLSSQELAQKGMEKFIEEGRMLAKIRGLNGIVQVRDCFQENGRAYIVMEFAEGQTLEEILKNSEGRLPAGQVFEMMRPVIKSLGEIHKKGLLHLNINPGNLMVDADGNVTLLDFGAVCNYFEEHNYWEEEEPHTLEPWEDEPVYPVILETGYSPEEQYCSGGDKEPCTDVYALCATMYRAITGERPTDSLSRCYNDDLRKPSSYGIAIGEQQEAALMKGLAVYKKDRFESMEELRNALYQDNPDTCHSTESNPAEGRTPIYLSARRRQGRPGYF